MTSSMASDVPAVMSARSGEIGKPCEVSSLATASRAAGIPGDGPYPLKPSRIARSTAAMRCGGVLKPKTLGSPTFR